MLHSKQNLNISQIGFISRKKANIFTAIIFSVIVALHIILVITSKSVEIEQNRIVRQVTLNFSPTISKKVAENSSQKIPEVREVKRTQPIKQNKSPIKEVVPKKVEPIQETVQKTIPEKIVPESKIEEITTNENFAGTETATATETSNSAESENSYATEISNLQAMIISEIQKNKLYPLAARKRGLQGDVKLSFTVNADGTVSNLQVLNTEVSSLLCEAAKKAVKNSFPINLQIKSPFNMNVTLRYEISN